MNLDDGQLVPAGLPADLAVVVRRWQRLRSALLNAALTVHQMTCNIEVRIADCPNPECVYRIGLIDQTGWHPSDEQRP